MSDSEDSLAPFHISQLNISQESGHEDEAHDDNEQSDDSLTPFTFTPMSIGDETVTDEDIRPETLVETPTSSPILKPRPPRRATRSRPSQRLIIDHVEEEKRDVLEISNKTCKASGPTSVVSSFLKTMVIRFDQARHKSWACWLQPKDTVFFKTKASAKKFKTGVILGFARVLATPKKRWLALVFMLGIGPVVINIADIIPPSESPSACSAGEWQQIVSDQYRCDACLADFVTPLLKVDKVTPSIKVGELATKAAGRAKKGGKGREKERERDQEREREKEIEREQEDWENMDMSWNSVNEGQSSGRDEADDRVGRLEDQFIAFQARIAELVTQSVQTALNGMNSAPDSSTQKQQQHHPQQHSQQHQHYPQQHPQHHQRQYPQQYQPQQPQQHQPQHHHPPQQARYQQDVHRSHPQQYIQHPEQQHPQQYYQHQFGDLSATSTSFEEPNRNNLRMAYEYQRKRNRQLEVENVLLNKEKEVYRRQLLARQFRETESASNCFTSVSNSSSVSFF